MEGWKDRAEKNQGRRKGRRDTRREGDERQPERGRDSAVV